MCAASQVRGHAFKSLRAGARVFVGMRLIGG